MILALLLAGSSVGVRRSEFKTCAQSGFCGRQRAYAELTAAKQTLEATFSVVPGSWTFSDAIVTANVMGIDPADVFVAVFSFAQTHINFQLTLRNASLTADPFEKQTPSNAVCETREGLVVCTSQNNVLTIHSSPFRWSIAHNGTEAVAWNSLNNLYVETPRERSDTGKEPAFSVAKNDQYDALRSELVANYWQETFNNHIDEKPNGPNSVGFDVVFPGAQHTYGIPEHASSFALKDTRGPDASYSDPYRLYNLDVFEYELDNPMALYGSIPFMMAHKSGQTTAILWMNAAEMWIDIQKAPEGTQTHWMAETGSINMFIFLGPTQSDIFNAYTALSGRPQLPQEFAIAYHQCRWNYKDQDDVLQVDQNFDKHNIPYDVLWLDIEHTNGKRYFTWDAEKFPEPEQMQDNLASKGRKMVTIVDPHLKKDSTYAVSSEALAQNLFVRTQSGSVFDGYCWPGDSNWLDYTNIEARKFWASKFTYDQYLGSTPNLYTWNDMNEPSVFSGPEITMPKTTLHFGDIEHREVHNLYGMLQQASTYDGHLLRNDGTDRPFILSRAFYVGTQKYGAIWTGDNDASWEHLQISIPMLLTIGASGVTFAGADVGGFFRDPEPELLMRWYQLGSLQPFFRAHAHIDTKRREPWLFGEPYTTLIREAVQRRYRLLPYIYTLFSESHAIGTPIMRAMMYMFPNDPNTFAMDDQFMLGNALVVKPVIAKGQVQVWYEYKTWKRIIPSKDGLVTVDAPLNKIPIFVRGGSIIPRRDRVRKSSVLMHGDPYTLIFALDSNGEASGNIYIDDGRSFENESGSYSFSTISISNGTIDARNLQYDGTTIDEMKRKQTCAKFGGRVEKIVVLGMRNVELVRRIGKTDDSESTGYEFLVVDGTLVIKDPKMSVCEQWKFQIEY